MGGNSLCDMGEGIKTKTLQTYHFSGSSKFFHVLHLLILTKQNFTTDIGEYALFSLLRV